MIELDMVYVSYFGDFLSIGSRESFEQNILFRLSPPRKACRPPRKAARPAGIACRPGPALIWKPPLRPLRNTAPNHGATFPVTSPAPFTSPTPFISPAPFTPYSPQPAMSQDSYFVQSQPAFNKPAPMMVLVPVTHCSPTPPQNGWTIPSSIASTIRPCPRINYARLFDVSGFPMEPLSAHRFGFTILPTLGGRLWRYNFRRYCRGLWFLNYYAANSSLGHTREYLRQYPRLCAWACSFPWYAGQNVRGSLLHLRRGSNAHH